jgi:murein L,D-transpeptidase YcbB/YkuD
VPRGITVREMLPQIRRHADYLQRNHLELVDGQADASPVVVPTPANIEALAAGRLRLRQRPGDDNALGLIKFMFPNSHNVYMHSTPAHRLFAESRRAFSHGCIRVSDPAALAEYVLRNAAGDWTRERIEAAMNGADNQRVDLQQWVRVLIVYGTAVATEAGSVYFFNDIYGNDARLTKLLAH